MKLQSMIAAVALISMTACGIKGDPQPPEEPVPDPPENFILTGRESCAVLKWKAPEKKPEGGYMASRARLDPAHPGLIAFSEYKKLQPDSDKFTDCELEPGTTYIYRIAGLNEKGKPGKPTASIKLVNLPPPPAPVNIQASPGDRFIDLEWNMPEGTQDKIAFQVYRADNPENFSLKPVNPEPIIKQNWTDGGLENDKTYFYQVRAVATAESLPTMEGPPGKTLQVVPKDKIAPIPPRALSAMPVKDGILLRWLPNKEPDLQGYNIYRSIKKKTAFRIINQRPVKETEYLDPSPAPPGSEISYYITAVDNASEPNESKRSSIEKVFIPVQ